MVSVSSKLLSHFLFSFFFTWEFFHRYPEIQGCLLKFQRPLDVWAISGVCAQGALFCWGNTVVKSSVVLLGLLGFPGKTHQCLVWRKKVWPPTFRDAKRRTGLGCVSASGMHSSGNRLAWLSGPLSPSSVASVVCSLPTSPRNCLVTSLGIHS